MKKHDFVSSARTRQTSKEVHGWCRAPQSFKKITGLDFPRELRSSVSRGSDSPLDCHSLPLPFSPLTSPKTKSRPQGPAFYFWSGLRGSNPPPPPWQGGALPNELNPHIWCLRSESNQRHGDFQSPALPTELQRHIGWRLGWGSNPRPLA